MRLSILLLFLSSFCYSQIPVVSTVSRSAQASPQFRTPDIFASEVYGTSIDLSWTEGADGYTLERSTNSDFSGATVIYTGSNSTFEDTGLSLDVRYYYRVCASETGFSTSEYGTTSAKTISFDPLFWYDAGRFKAFASNVNEDNVFYETTGASVNSLKSVINFSGPEAVQSSASPAVTEFKNRWLPNSGINASSSSHYTLDASETATADWTFLCEGSPGASGGNRVLVTEVSPNANFSWVSWPAGTTVSVRINNNTYTITFADGATTVSGIQYELAIQRNGSNLRAKLNRGNWSANVSCVTNDWIVGRLFANATGGNNFGAQTVQRIALSDDLLTDAQMNDFFDFLKNPEGSFTAEDNTSEGTGLTYSAGNLTNGYWSDVSAPALNTFSREMVWSVGETSYIASALKHSEFTATNFRMFSHALGQGSGILQTSTFANNEDSHNYSSIYPFNNRLYLYQPNTNYTPEPPDAGDNFRYIIRQSGAGFNLGQVTRVPHSNGGFESLAVTTQYHMWTSIGNTLYCVYQDHQTWPRRICMMRSSDGGYNWEKEIVCDVNTTNVDWFYPHLIYNGTNNEIYLIVVKLDVITGPDEYSDVYFLRSSGDGVWRNIDNSHSINVRTGNFLTWADLDANGYAIAQDAPISYLIGGFHVTSTGLVYGVISDGNDTGWNLVRGQIGSAGWDSDAITWSGKTVVTNTKDETGSAGINAFNRSAPEVWRTGDGDYSVAGLETNSGNWRVIETATTDDGATWAYVQDLSETTDTEQYLGLQVSKNYEYNDYAIITGSRATSSTEANVWVKEIKAP